MADLKFNIDKISEMKKLCDDLIDGEDGLNQLSEDLHSKLEDKLLNDWNTPAGKKFFEDLDADWSEQVQQYTKIIGAVSDLLEEAITQYSKVEEAANGLSV